MWNATFSISCEKLCSMCSMLIFCLTQKFEWQIDPTVNSKIKNLGLDHVHVNWSCEFIVGQM